MMSSEGKGGRNEKEARSDIFSKLPEWVWGRGPGMSTEYSKEKRVYNVMENRYYPMCG